MSRNVTGTAPRAAHRRSVPAGCLVSATDRTPAAPTRNYRVASQPLADEPNQEPSFPASRWGLAVWPPGDQRVSNYLQRAARRAVQFRVGTPFHGHSIWRLFASLRGPDRPRVGDRARAPGPGAFVPRSCTRLDSHPCAHANSPDGRQAISQPVAAAFREGGPERRGYVVALVDPVSEGTELPPGTTRRRTRQPSSIPNSLAISSRGMLASPASISKRAASAAAASCASSKAARARLATSASSRTTLSRPCWVMVTGSRWARSRVCAHF